MGYRRSAEDAASSRAWCRFTDSHVALIAEAGLPGWVTASRERWVDFLMHGYLDHHPDPARFTVNQLSDAQYAALVRLAEMYFDAGHGYFEPMGLRRGGVEDLRARFAPSDS